MNASEFAILGFGVGGFAAAVGIFCVALQIRRGRELALGLIHQYGRLTFQRNLDRLARYPAVVQTGLADFSQLRSQDKMVFGIILSHLVEDYEQTLEMHQRGLESRIELNRRGAFCLALLKEPGGLEWWRYAQRFFDDETRSHLDIHLVDPGESPPPVSDTLPWLRPDRPEDVE